MHVSLQNDVHIYIYIYRQVVYLPFYNLITHTRYPTKHVYIYICYFAGWVNLFMNMAQWVPVERLHLDTFLSRFVVVNSDVKSNPELQKKPGRPCRSSWCILQVLLSRRDPIGTWPSHQAKSRRTPTDDSWDETLPATFPLYHSIKQSISNLGA